MRVAIAGGGWVAEARHLPCFLAQPGVTVLGVIDPRPGRSESLARRFRLPRAACADRFQEVPWLAEADALVVTTPPATHFAWIAAALV